MKVTPDTPHVHKAIKDIFLDGVQMRRVVYFDTETGELHQLRVDQSGKLILDEEDEPVLNKLIGVLSFSFEPDWGMKDGEFTYKGSKIQ